MESRGFKITYILSLSRKKIGMFQRESAKRYEKRDFILLKGTKDEARLQEIARSVQHWGSGDALNLNISCVMLIFY